MSYLQIPQWFRALRQWYDTDVIATFLNDFRHMGVAKKSKVGTLVAVGDEFQSEIETHF